MVNLDYLYNPDAAKKYFGKNYFIDKKLGFSVIENGTILPHKSHIEGLPNNFWGYGGIVDSNGKYIKSSYVNDSGASGIYTPPPQDIQHSSDTVIYLGMSYNVWGHVLTDNIRRVWFFKSATFKSDFQNCPVVYIPWRDGYYTIERQKSFKRLLEILEIDVDKIQPITQPTQFERIILPDGAFLSYGLRGFTAEYNETIDRVKSFALKNRTSIANKKFYYMYGVRQYGEEILAKYFESKGYKVFRPERLTLDEQLNLLINCESFASTLGSCAHNSVFLREGTETIFIPRTIGRYTGFQQIIDQVNSLKANYIDSSMSIFATAWADYCFIISEQLKSFFGDKFDGYKDEDFKLFLQYVKNSISKGLNVNSNQILNYGIIFKEFMEQFKRREDLITACDMPVGWEKLRPLLTYQTHVDKHGWGAWNDENQISNPLDQKRDIQAIKINFPNHKVYYSVYYNTEEGWSEEVEAPEAVGTVGRRKPIFGLRIRLDEAGAKDFDVLYRVYKFDDRWTDWAKNGEALYSHGVRLNAIQVKLRPLLNYQTHVHNRGWCPWSTENQISNPLDQKLDILAIRLNFLDASYKIYYAVYFNEKEGWSKEVLAPEMAGTVGIHKPIFGMKIRLDEASVKECSILYRMHTFEGEWTPWIKDGEALYSHGVKVNAIQIKLEPKSDASET